MTRIVLKRMPGWRGRLARTVSDWSARPFEPGVTDCAMFAAACVEAVTDVDLAAEWRGRYETEDDGRSLIKAAGMGTPLTLLRRTLPEVSRGAALPGDLAVLPSGSVAPRAYAVVQGPQLFLVGATGLFSVSREAGRWFFRVGGAI